MKIYSNSIYSNNMKLFNLSILLLILFLINPIYASKVKKDNNVIQVDCNWLKISNGLPNDKINDIIQYTDGNLFLATQNNGVFVSADTGKTWLAYNSGLTNFHTINFAYNSNGYLYLATNGGGVYQRKVGQTQWIQINNGLGNLNVNCVLASQFEGLVAGTSDGFYMYNSSTNKWSDSSTGLVNRNITSLTRTTNGYIIAGTKGNGVFRKIQTSPWESANAGITNGNINTTMAYNTTFLLAGSDQGLFYSSSSASTWFKRNALPDAKFTDLSINTNNNYVYAATDGFGVYLSSNNGLNWVPLNNGLFNLQISAILALTNGTVLAGTINGEIYKLDQCDAPNSYITFLSPKQGDTLYSGKLVTINWSSYGITKVAILYSTNGGTSFTTIGGNIDATLGTYNWLVPSGLFNTNSVLKIKSTTSQDFALSGIISLVDSNLVLMEITNPIGGEKFLSQSILTIKWNSQYSTSATLQFSNDNGITWNNISNSVKTTDGGYNYVLPNVNSDSCRIRIFDNTFKSKLSITNTFQIIDKSKFSLKLLTPVSGEQWQINSTQTIRWESQGLDTINIFLSTDSGDNWSILASNIDATLGVLSINVPFKPSSTCKIKIVSKLFPNDFSSTSIGLFSIIGLHLTNPNFGIYMGDSIIPITWESMGTQNIRLSYSIDGGNSWNLIVDNYPALSGIYSWKIPKTPSNSCKIRIMDTKQSSIFDDSDSLFTIKGIRLINPLGGENYLVGQSVNIKWDYITTEKINILFSSNNGFNWVTIASNVKTSDSSYLWTVPNTATDNGFISIVDINNSSFSDSNVIPFKIQGNGIVLLSPIGGEELISGTPTIIRWTSVNSLKLNINISYDKGHSWSLIADSIPSSSGSFQWFVADTSSTEALIKLVDSYNNSIKDSSKSTFRIKRPGNTYPPPTDWFSSIQTGENAFIIIPDTINPQIGDRNLKTGDYVSIWYNNGGTLQCGGLSKWISGNNMSITVWGDNQYTEVKDGFFTNENYIYKIWDGENGVAYYAIAKYGTNSSSNPNLYAANKISYVSSLSSSNNLTITLNPSLINLVSSNVIPDNMSIENIFAGIQTYIKYVANQYGENYYPSYNINQIGNWNISHGYQVALQSTSSTRTLSIVGQMVKPEDYPLTFEQRKWYIIPFLPMLQMRVSDAMQTISNKILLLKDESGKSFIPNSGLDEIKVLYPGKGYKLITKDNTTFIYPNSNFYYGSIVEQTGDSDLIYKPKYIETGNSANISVEIDSATDLNDEVVVLTSNGAIIGSAKVSQPLTTFTIWGDNLLTDSIVEGAEENESLSLKLFSPATNSEKELEVTNIVDLINGNEVKDFNYHQDAFYYVKSKIKEPQSVPESQSNPILIYPNPTSSLLNINLKNNCGKHCSIKMTNILGDIAGNLYDGIITSNNFNLSKDLQYLTNGSYQLIIEINGQVQAQKIEIMK